MGMLDIQRNHATMFNIRLGEKVKARSGKDAPSRLQDKMRVTSPNRNIVDAFVEVYGGETMPWEAQWQSYLPSAIRIMLLPGQSITQWWELYKGGTCDRRCEGTGGTETLSGKACMCSPDIAARQSDPNQCSPMTRLNFLCPDVGTLGAGSLVTHGRIAAETLPQEVTKAEIALRAGHPVPAILRSVHQVGKNKQYVVPRIEIVGASYYGLASGDLTGVNTGELQSGGVAGPSEPSGGNKELASIPSGDAGSAAAPSDSGESTPANQAMKTTIRRQAKTKGLSDDDLEVMVMDLTGRYLEEPEFTVEMSNAVLTALRKK